MVEIFVEITYTEWVDGSTCCISTAESRAPSLKQLFGQKAQRNRRVGGPLYLTEEPDQNLGLSTSIQIRIRLFTLI